MVWVATRFLFFPSIPSFNTINFLPIKHEIDTMALHSVTQEKEVLQTLSEYKASSQKTRLCGKTSLPAVNPPGVPTIADNCFGQLEDGMLNRAIRDQYDATKRRLTTGTINEGLCDGNQSPPPLSPVASSSTSTTPGTTRNLWDSPETPHYQLERKSLIEVLTPGTPPTTYSVTAKEKFILTPPSSRTKTSTIFDAIEARITHPGGRQVEGNLVDPGQEEFIPKKLIRGLTAEFLASKFYLGAQPHGQHLTPFTSL